MKAKAVSALRSKRGLRPVKRVAEPQVVGLAPQTTHDRRANTMKNYILRKSKTVEAQSSSRRLPAPPGPAVGENGAAARPRQRPSAKSKRQGRQTRSERGPQIRRAGSTTDGKDARRDHNLKQAHALSAPQSFPILWRLGRTLEYLMNSVNDMIKM
jgi:hypothetical protein